MEALRIAAAQCGSVAGDIEGNLQRHLHFIVVAARHGVNLLVFPELSLTGYEPELAQSLALSIEDERLLPLRIASQRAGMTVVTGLPVSGGVQQKPLIGAVTFTADGAVELYSKQHLHSGEERYFAGGKGGKLLCVKQRSIGLAVCADFSQGSHVREAAQQGAQLYAASVLIGEGGYPVDSALLEGYARTHGIAVLMANHGAPTGGWKSAGRSAIWDCRGNLVVAAQSTGDRLLVASWRADEMVGEDLAVY